MCDLRRLVQAEVRRPECFTWSCLYTPADSHRFCSEWVTLDVVAFTNLSACHVAKRMRNGTIGCVSRSASSSCTWYRSHVPGDVELWLDCGDLRDSAFAASRAQTLFVTCLVSAVRKSRKSNPEMKVTWYKCFLGEVAVLYNFLQEIKLARREATGQTSQIQT